MNRRHFLAVVAAVPLAGARPAPFSRLAFLEQTQGGGWSAQQLKAFQHRYFYARVAITPEMLAAQQRYNWQRALELEIIGVVDDLDPPHGQHCDRLVMRRGGGFAHYAARDEAIRCSA